MNGVPFEYPLSRLGWSVNSFFADIETILFDSEIDVLVDFDLDRDDCGRRTASASVSSLYKEPSWMLHVVNRIKSFALEAAQNDEPWLRCRAEKFLDGLEEKHQPHSSKED